MKNHVLNTTLNNKAFKSTVKSEIESIVNDHGWSFDVNYQRGIAFQIWCASLLITSEGFDLEPEDCVLYSQDLKADIVLEDETRKYLLIAQCKYEGISNKRQEIADESMVCDFFNRHSLFLNREWVKEHGNDKAFDALGEYQDKINDGYKIEYIFMTTSNASDRIHEAVETIQNTFRNSNINIQCTLLDIEHLKEQYIRSRSLEESIPKEVRMEIPVDRFFEKTEGPYPTIIGIIKGNAIKNMYKQYKESLFAWNIRGYLGKRGINKDIIDTADKSPGDFFYYNNGISAICTDYKLVGEFGNILIAENFQIINGAQTVGALGRAKDNNDIYILFRLTKTLKVKTDKGINNDIIRYNNTQNIIKISDFRSNDPIQKWIETKFKTIKSDAQLPTVNYQRKRSSKKAIGKNLRLEELARIRFAFLYEPTFVHASPKDLWTLIEDGGRYEDVFGIDGELVEMWSEEDFNKTYNAIIIFDKIEHEIKQLIKHNKSLMYIKRFRYHILSLFGTYINNTQQYNQGSKILKKEQIEELWNEIWNDIERIIIDLHIEEIETKPNGSLHALIRNSDKYLKMKLKLLRYKKLNLNN